MAAVSTAGGATPTSTTAPATSVVASSTACLFGTWSVTSPQGYAGTTWDIHTGGSITVDYKGLLSGAATFSSTIPASPQGKTGSYVATPVSQDVTADGHPITLGAHGTTWTCEGSSLTLVVSPGGTFQLTRTAS